MSALFDRLSALFERGHQTDIPDLLSDQRFAIAERTADAAVLIAVTDRPEPGLILTQRPTTMRDHPGQVAFPGGKVDDGETSVEAALREAEEELALDRKHVRLIGTTDRYQTGTGFDITPVLGVVPPDLSLTPHPREVEAWFEVPVAQVFNLSNWTENEVFWRGEMRHYLEMDWQGFRIWGVTAAIIANLSRRIAVEELLGG
ncbi:CoA pyrophosphatase [Pontixanthobacter aestiaquae]|uniref:CoA pyrophosphatase n=1 Tax=Pontixanthobacter aestiaquae TaxID=1509367 RepID=A0A844Z5L3_9SPHN|nr:CoA pyrophosphatase [Pontixanthobacter aestiaquae]MDN3645939.1 CoA pyrophosphatase [Pontixanthobacter aestiaquae]MXO83068.1 CoA pyrophosphatase [Pontixanthobacter aestiaquae]